MVAGQCLSPRPARGTVEVGQAPLTGNLKGAEAPGNVLLAARATGLPKPSVANVSQVVTLDRDALAERAGRLSASSLELVLAGIDVVLGRG
jgi:mRNA interferase MazF